MTRAEAEKKISAAIGKAGYQVRVKDDADHVHVVGLGSDVRRVRLSVTDLSAETVKAAIAAIGADESDEADTPTE